MEFLLFPLLVLILVSSVFTLVAFSATRRLESMLSQFPLNQLAFRIYQLEKKLEALQQLSSVPAQPGSEPAAQTSPPPAVAAPSSAPAQPPPAPAPPISQPPHAIPVPGYSPLTLPSIAKPPLADGPPDLESAIGGRWFNRIGIIALLFAVSYFLKLAFDNNWIGPAGRVAIGIFLGALMLPWSHWLLGRGYSYFSEGIAGLGEATLFVSIWAGCQYYTLFSRDVGFVALVVVTIVMAFLALSRNSPRIAFLSLLGGLLTPALVSSGQNHQVMLFTYLFCLGAAALFICFQREWHLLLPLVFIGTHLYFWEWYDTFYTRAGFLESTVFFSTLFFLLYSAAPVVRIIRRLDFPAMDVLLIVSNAIVYSCALYVLLWPRDRWPLTVFFLLLAAAHLLIARLAVASNAPESALPSQFYTGLAVAFFTLTIPIRLEHNWITLAFAVEGAALVWTGFYSLRSLLRSAGYFLIAIAAFRLLILPPPAGLFLFNERFFSYLLLIACLATCLWAAHLHADDSTRGSTEETGVLSVFTNLFVILALSLEFWDYFGLASVGFRNSLAQHLSLSVLWTCYAAVLIFLGMWRRSALLRWQALFLLGVVVVKVFFYDLASLDRAYRILSFFILGSVLLAVSFFYQRKIARDRSAS